MEITKEYKVRRCDKCEADGDALNIESCYLCGKDLCSECLVYVNGWRNSELSHLLNRVHTYRGTAVCPDHLPEALFK